MGGYSSTRWKIHNKKGLVEDSMQLNIAILDLSNKELSKKGTIDWKYSSDVSQGLSFEIIGEEPVQLELLYTYSSKLTTEEVCKYRILITTTPLPWGGKKYWFECPNIPCKKRCRILYLPYGAKYFACRECHNLTYRSNQEQNQNEYLTRYMYRQLKPSIPHLTMERLNNMFSKKDDEDSFASLDHWNRKVFKYEQYLSKDEIIQQSGLSPVEFELLENHKLLLPDYKGLFRPKLVSWAKKLKYLLSEGWNPKEILSWSKGRWKSKKPKKWPPNRTDRKL